MRRPRWWAANLLLAAAAVAFGFLVAVQVRAGLIPSSDALARTQALVRSALDLEQTNAADRDRIAQLRSQISALEAEAAQRSDAARALADQLSALRAQSGLTPLRGPGVVVTLGDGQPGGPELADHLGYQIGFQDIQDVVNLLYAAGAEGVAVNGRRITTLSGFRSDGVDVLIDQGPPLDSPFKISAIGDQARLEEALQDPTGLPDVRLRVERFQVRFTWAAEPDILLPAYDSSLAPTFAHAG